MEHIKCKGKMYDLLTSSFPVDLGDPEKCWMLMESIF